MEDRVDPVVELVEPVTRDLTESIRDLVFKTLIKTLTLFKLNENKMGYKRK